MDSGKHNADNNYCFESRKQNNEFMEVLTSLVEVSVISLIDFNLAMLTHLVNSI